MVSLLEKNIKAAKEFLEWPLHDEFHVPEEAKKHFENFRKNAVKNEEKWGYSLK